MGPRSNILFAFAVAVLLVAAYFIRDVLLLIYASALFAVMVAPFVHRIEALRIGSWHAGRGAAIVAIILSGVGLGVLAGFVIVPPIAEQFQQFVGGLPGNASHLLQRLREVPAWSSISPDVLQGHISDLAARAVKLVPGIAAALFSLLTLLVLTAYFIIDGERAFSWSISLFPVDAQPRLARALVHARDKMRKWLIGQLLLMLILGGLSAVVYGALGLRYFLLLAVITGAANIVPIVGPVTSVLLASITAGLDSWTKALGVLAFYVVYQQLENAFLTPRIMKETVGLPGLAVLVALSIGGALGGLLGALVAVPSAALIAVLTEEYVLERRLKSA